MRSRGLCSGAVRPLRPLLGRSPASSSPQAATEAPATVRLFLALPLFPQSGPSGHVCPVHLQTSLSPALSALFGQSAVVVAFRPLRLFPSMSWPLSGHCLCSARLNAASASGRLCAFRSAVVRPFLPLRLLSSHFRCYDCCLRPTVASAFVRQPPFRRHSATPTALRSLSGRSFSGFTSISIYLGAVDRSSASIR